MRHIGERRFDWDEHNIRHLKRHQVEPGEFEEVLANGPVRVETRIDSVTGEERILELGHTDADRVLFVVWTLRGATVRPMTAFDANRKVRSAYRRRAGV